MFSKYYVTAFIMSMGCVFSCVKATKPSIVPTPNFNATNDAKAVKSRKFNGESDDIALVRLSTSRSFEQRKSIRNEFRKLYNKDMLTDMEGDLKGDTLTFITALFQEPSEFYAAELKFAMKGLGTNEDILTEVICTRTSGEISSLKSAYKNLYNNALEKDIKDETSGDYRKLLLALLNKQRSTSAKPQEADGIVTKSTKAFKRFFGTDEEALIKIFSETSVDLMKIVMKKYLKKTGKTLNDMVKKDTSGDFRKGLLTILEWIENPVSYFAKQLHDALDKFMVNKRGVIRNVISRSEIDLDSIENEHVKIYHQSLRGLAESKLPSKLKTGILALLDGNND